MSLPLHGTREREWPGTGGPAGIIGEGKWWEIMQGKVTYVSMEDDPAIHAAYEKALGKAEGELGQRYPLIIAGREVRTEKEFEVRSPIDRDILIGSFQLGGEGEARRAFRAAKEAFPAWSGVSPGERTRILRRTARLLEKDLNRLAALITLEAGKNRFEAVAEVREAVDMLRYHAALYEKNNGYEVPLEPEAPGATGASVMKPHGAWAVISPFNFPIDLAAGMAGAALLTGNTVVFKPTSATPLAGLMLYRAFIAGGVPPGAINYVTGPGAPFGEVAVSSSDVDGIALTGSRDAGT